MTEEFPSPIGDKEIEPVELPVPALTKNVIYWSLYDLGNTIFSMVVVSLSLGPLIYIMYFNELGDGKLAVNRGNYAISTTLLIGNILMALISPFLGAYADQKKKRRNLLMKITMLCITFMAAMVYSAFSPNVIAILAIFLFANLFYQMGLVVYDSMIPFITTKENIGKVSGFGVALGYFGSFFGIGLGFALKPIYGDYFASAANPAKGTEDHFVLGYLPYIFPYAAALFLLFALPMFAVKEREPEFEEKNLRELVPVVIEDVTTTGAEVLAYREMRTFLLGWLIFVDVANTVIAFMSIMVSVGLEFGEGAIVLVVLAIGIGSAVIFTYPVGMYVDKHGPRKGLTLVYALWMISLILGVLTNLKIGDFVTPKFTVYIFPILVGPALGGSWVIQRQYINELAPPKKIGNYFGFTNIFGRISAAVGPFLWSFTIDILIRVGFPASLATRSAIVVLMIMMTIGFAILATVKTPHAAYVQGARALGDVTWTHTDGTIIDKDGEKFL